MQCDKGPETLAPEVRIRDIQEHEWNRSNETKGEPKRVAWSFSWASVWMLRAIEASQVSVGGKTG